MPSWIHKLALIALSSLALSCSGSDQVELEASSSTAADPDAVEPRLVALAVLSSPLHDSAGPGGSPVLSGPVYPLIASDSTIWVVDSPEARLVRFSFGSQDSLGFVGSPGRGPGEFSSPVGVDETIDGRILVADLGNARLSEIVADSVVDELPTSVPPLSVSVVGTETWILTPIQEGLFAVYDSSKEETGRVGEQPFAEREMVRSNQGVASRGNPSDTGCAVAVAFVFIPEIRCYSQDRRLAWARVAPDETAGEWERRLAEPPLSDRIAYVDVAQGDGWVAALYFGGEPTRETGLATTTVHVFASVDGEFQGSFELPSPAKYLDVGHGLLVTVEHDPFPTVRVFSLSGLELAR